MISPRFAQALLRKISACPLLVLVISTAALAQQPSVLTGPDLQLIDTGIVMATARAPDGSIFVGGDFASIAGVPRAHIAKLRADGTLDPEWNPGADDKVLALATDSDGSVYVGGDFGHIGGQERSYLAKIGGSGAGVVDANWNPHSTGPIEAIAVDADGSVFVSGLLFVAVPGFSTIGGQPRNSIAKLSGSGDGDADPLWNPDPIGEITTIVVDRQGSVFVGGSSFTINSQSRSLFKLDAEGTGAPDAQWNPPDPFLVHAMAVDGQGYLYLAGISGIGKYSTEGDGAPDPDWLPESANTSFSALLVDGSGGLFAATSMLPPSVVRYEGNGNLDPDWNIAVDSGGSFYAVSTIAMGSDSMLIMGGDLTAVSGQVRRGLAELSNNAALLAAVDAEKPGSVSALAREQDGSLLVGGSFFRSGAVERHNLLRVRQDGTVDLEWQPDPDGNVVAIATDEGAAIYIGGHFQHAGGAVRNNLAKLAATGAGAADESWAPGANFVVNSLAIDPVTDALFVGGAFSTVGGQPRIKLAKIDAAGAVDASWNPSISSASSVAALVADGTGALYVGGSFSSLGGHAETNLARLSVDGVGSADASWSPSIASVNALAIGPDGMIYVVGSGSSGYLARISAPGSGNVDSSWSPDVNLYTANCLAIDSENQMIYVGGNYSSTEQHVARASMVGAGTVDPTWTPTVNGGIAVLAATGTSVYLGGSFDGVEGLPRAGFAAFGLDEIFKDSFE